jgi:hypothetical protein
MIGSLDQAMAALEAFRMRDHTHVYSFDGSTRMVYRFDNVIYKVNLDAWNTDWNRIEWDRIANVDVDLPENVRYPEANLFEVNDTAVIAMEFIDGQPISECYCLSNIEECEDDCMTDDEVNLLVPLMSDPGGFNTIRCDDGTYVIIDVA